MIPINEYVDTLINSKRYEIIVNEVSITKSNNFIQTTDFKIHNVPVKIAPFIKGNKDHEKYRNDILKTVEETGNNIIKNWSKIVERILADYRDYIISSGEELWINEYKKCKNLTEYIKLNRVTALIISKSPVKLTYELRISCLDHIIDSELVIRIKITGKNSIWIDDTEWD